jgi:protein TonB
MKNAVRYTSQPLSGQTKLSGLVFAGVVHAALLLALLSYSHIAPSLAPSDDLSTFEIMEPEPPPPPAKTAPQEEGASGKKAAKAEPSPIVAPVPVIQIPVPPIITAAPIAADGIQAKSGASDSGVDGTGGADEGTGTGSGGSGRGPGGGGVATQPTLIRGEIVNRDYPRSAAKARAEGTVIAYYTVLPNGRVEGCFIHQSSGNAALDATTCDLIEKRFRYRPAMDRQGRPTAYETGWRQIWWLGDR